MRALTIGVVYFAGFFFGALLSGILKLPTDPTLVILGNSLGAPGYRTYLVVAVALAIVCWALRAWGGAYLRPATVWNADALDDRLIVEGPFRFVRNPLYLGNIALALAIGLYATPLGAAIIVIGNIVVAFALISVEESLLRAHYGTAFDAYAGAVPALFPRLVPWKGTPATKVTPSLALGLRSEIFSAAFILGTAAFAIHFWNG
jgi:protein-S-isoprenylcysteine O-methyltransferase Ste14